MKKTTVAVLFGGASSEHEVSLRSATTVLEHIPTDRYDVKMLGITKDGRWLFYNGEISGLLDGSWEQNGIPALISPDRSIHGMLIFHPDQIETVPLDVIYPALHGKHGEDGTLQGLCAVASIPCVGCGTAASALCMDKEFTNALADQANIAQANWVSLKQHTYHADKEHTFLKQAANTLGFPIFVKPANAGSSVGVNKATDLDSLKSAVETAFLHDRKLVLEEGIVGQEVECAVLGNDAPIASTIGEILPCNDFYDYNAKYVNENSKLLIPAHIQENVATEIQKIACQIFHVYDCAGLSRIDFFVRTSDNAVLFNELNTLPGFTSISMYPKLFETDGILLPELIDRLITLALERGRTQYV